MRQVEKIVQQGHGPLDASYLVIHETANPGATALNHVQYWRNNPDVPATHYVLDWTSTVYHTVEDDRLCWHVGNGNSWCVGIELCHATNAEDFIEVWNTAVEWAAWYLNKRGWSIDRMISHNDARLKWGGTDHTDPLAYFQQFGKSWRQFKAQVKERMKGDGDMPTPEELWNYPINGVSAKERLYLDNKQLFDRTDYSGRGKDGSTVIERVCWIAKKQDDQQKQLDRIEKKLDQLAGK